LLLSTDGLTTGTDDRDQYDALDEALMETFPASDPIAVSEPIRRHVVPTLPCPRGKSGDPDEIGSPASAGG
jgi:hypothetical protein